MLVGKSYIKEIKLLLIKLVRELLQTVKLINIYEINVLRHF